MTLHAHDEAREQDVLDCLDEFLSSNNCHARVDTSGPVALREILIECERRAKQEVAYHLQHVPAEKRRPTYVFFCENETYGAFALRGRYDYIVLHIGTVPALLDFYIRMMAKAELWKNIGDPASASDDPARLAFATVFVGECLSFLVRHELAHLVLGHCEFVAPKGRPATIEEDLEHARYSEKRGFERDYGGAHPRPAQHSGISCRAAEQETFHGEPDTRRCRPLGY